MKVSTLAAILGAFVGFVASAPSYETNAQRMARGLPPNPPKFLREPTSVQVARRTQPSPQPPVKYTGRLEVRTQEGHNSGHVRNWETPGTISGVNFLGPEDDLLVSIIPCASGEKLFDIFSTNPKFPAPFYVGAAGSTLIPGERSVISFTNVEQTSPNSLPSSSPRGGFVESAIWTIDSNTKELKAQWINPDGSRPPTVLAYNIRSNALFFVSDIDAWNENNNTPASAVKLFLVPV
ncbi:hypothetical protein BDQ12DRAFT_649266 [Crucibulum laeve]|uniref:Uncharacterized protein n=1 Tax=Crucibulum laeve TaxID=68775 RepID=A0A5C3M3M4_9AGAR|nr:hypothetical protein BDQ12DRAFT_649266 [Crucibulum laeve]